MLIKYKDADNEDGYEVDWAISVGGYEEDSIDCITETSDGGFIVGGIFNYFIITLGDKTIESPKLIKYKESENKEGYEVDWAASVGGNSSDEIKCITETSDGGYIVGGYFKSSSITVGSKTLPNEGNREGILIKYKKSDTKKGEYEVEWATSLGGERYEEITCITETSDGGYICRRIF